VAAEGSTELASIWRQEFKVLPRLCESEEENELNPANPVGLEVLFSKQRDIEAAFLSCYKGIFTASRLEGVEECLSGLEGRVSAEMNAALLKPCSIEEVSLALQFMGPFKLSSRPG